ncbi:MAG: hypothetical protein AABX12_04300 [Nanoarchaeota archaeon]
MNRKGEGMDNALGWYVAYFVLLVIFFIGSLYYVWGLQDGAALWEDVYAKEIVRIIERAQTPEEVALDVHLLTELAQKSGKSLKEVVRFDNDKHLVTVSTKPYGGTSYGYFHDVKIIDDWIELPSAESVNTLHFVVVPQERAA